MEQATVMYLQPEEMIGQEQQACLFLVFQVMMLNLPLCTLRNSVMQEAAFHFWGGTVCPQLTASIGLHWPVTCYRAGCYAGQILPRLLDHPVETPCPLFYSLLPA